MSVRTDIHYFTRGWGTNRGPTCESTILCRYTGSSFISIVRSLNVGLLKNRWTNCETSILKSRSVGMSRL